MENVVMVNGPKFRWKRSSRESGYVRSTSRWITNNATIAEVIQKAQNVQRTTWIRDGESDLRHPPEIFRAVLEGVCRHLSETGEIDVGSIDTGPVPEESTEAETDDVEIYDSISGALLDPELVKRARAEELIWVKKQEIYTKVPIETCWERTSRAPITLKWVDVNKGDERNPYYRSRLVAREVKRNGQRVLPDHMLFSSMPPLEALKVLCSLMVTLKVSRPRKKPLKLRLTDISRAHFYGRSQRDVFVELPAEDAESGKCGLLQRSMYGTQDASAIWQDDYLQLLMKNGFKKGRAAPSLLYHEGHEIRVLVHGDDFISLSDDDGQEFLSKVLAERYEFKVVGQLGPGEGDKQEMSVLNRTLRYVEGGTIEYEADQRHAEIIVRDLGLTEGKSVSTPSIRRKHEDVEEYLKARKLEPHESTQFRSMVMRASYLSQDRADIAEAVKNLARKMKEPNEEDVKDLKRLGRYLKGCPRVVTRFEPQKCQKELWIYSDSDHAGCAITRRSTSGTIMMLGRHCIKSSSAIQSTISLSSGESEYYGIVKAAALGMQMQSILADWSYKIGLRILTDSSAAAGTCSRRGLGKLRHIQTRFLWVQERVAQNHLVIQKIGTKSNCADMCTKPMGSEQIKSFMKSIGQGFREGRANTAKELVEYTTQSVESKVPDQLFRLDCGLNNETEKSRSRSGDRLSMSERGRVMNERKFRKGNEMKMEKGGSPHCEWGASA